MVELEPRAPAPRGWGDVVADGRVVAALAAGAVVRAVRPVGRVGSTQDEVRADLARGAAPGTLLVADGQATGRGRHGRRWDDGPTPLASLRVSVAVASPPVAPGWVPLAVGLAARDAVVALVAARRVAVKWPNDVVLVPPGGDLTDARKCAGVLVERLVDGTASRDVIGVGIDLDWRGAPPRPWTSVAEAVGAAVDPALALVALLAGLERWVGALARGGPGPDEVRARVRETCATLGRTVTVARPGGATLTGRAVDLDAAGRLVVATADGPVPVDAGEVTLAPDGPTGPTGPTTEVPA